MIHRLPFAAGLWLAALPAFAGLPPAADPERPVPAFSPAPALADSAASTKRPLTGQRPMPRWRLPVLPGRRRPPSQAAQKAA
jgi:hypothetical protein